jgi:hypothetical protein
VPQVRVSAPHDRFMTFLTAILVVMVLAHRVFNTEGYACAQPPHDRDTEIRHTSQKAPWRTRHQLLHGAGHFSSQIDTIFCSPKGLLRQSVSSHTRKNQQKPLKFVEIHQNINISKEIDTLNYK